MMVDETATINKLVEENKVLQGHIDDMRTDCMKLEAIREVTKIPDVWRHPDPIKAVRDILGPSRESDNFRSKEKKS